MLNNLSLEIYVVFAVICLATLFFFLRLITQPLLVNGKLKFSLFLTGGICTWIVVHSILAYNQFFLSSYNLPPRIFLVAIPATLLIFGSLYFLWRSSYFENIPLKTMTYIHTIRFPLELIVFTGFASAGLIPEKMTFHGTNFDILVGITAPIVGYLYFTRKSISWKVLLAWNIVSLALLINITFTAVLSMPYPFQQFGLEQPNLALLNFPFILVPALLVQVAYFCHIVSIHKLLCFKDQRQQSNKNDIALTSTTHP